MRQRTKNALRCFCRSEPLLAMYGLTESGAIYLHVRVYKQRVVYGEIYIERFGVVKLRCRNCERWHRVTIRQDQTALEETEPPAINPAD